MTNRSDSELIFFYNTENFFLPDNDTAISKGSKNSGLQNWDERKFIHKLNRIARVFQMVENQEGKLPMLIGVAEIQGEKVLQELIKLPPFFDKFKYIHYESLDERGVDVALLYDPEKIKITHSEPISYLFEINENKDEYIDTTRDILYCQAEFSGENLHLFVCHLPSKREKDVNKPKRDYIINDLKKKISEIPKDEFILIIGDFNENPDDLNLLKLTENEGENNALKNVFSPLFQHKEFSTYHIKEGLLFDQLIISDAFFKSDSALRFSKAKIFNPPEMCDTENSSIKKPYRTFAGRRYLGGYSDHFPVFISLKK
ncbi:endonuclease/exonuclease/phosphatase family protein [Frigoriflavimonas asaccharolytica]|uniref:Endonuclease/exonuclease/phosphatase domain-containing protein n=1 Tax=Frigoriflavimonas asaccharolytica TaxID=2735899 RepID=A0A8J8G9P4_9FLAO|nr:endonuclease [Frigoriflavimonas asaccharolytica]NRS93713.1 hypothetical protein [Frigoriflavimonas asaccharolytica]